MDATERELITDAIGVDRASENTFYSKSLWTPYSHPSAYGGQTMAQAIHCASIYANEASALHSFQCCFLHSTSDVLPLRFEVYTIKQGRTFSSVIVQASQGKRPCLILMCSFQKPEPHRNLAICSPIPDNVPSPDELELDMEYYLKQSFSAESEMRKTLLGIAEDRTRIPIILTVPMERITLDGQLMSMRWMKTTGAENYDQSIQKCILAYMSDFDFIGVAPKALNLSRLGHGPGTVEMISTLNHSMHFYTDNLNCSDWLLFVTTAQCAGYGRATVLGKFYTRSGELVGLALQEGVVKAYQHSKL